MSSQEATPIERLDALEQHTPRRIVRSTLRHIALVLDDEIARWEDDGGPVRQPSILEEALEAAIVEFYGAGGRAASVVEALDAQRVAADLVARNVGAAEPARPEWLYGENGQVAA